MAIAHLSTTQAANNQGTVGSTTWAVTCDANTSIVIVTCGYIHTGQSISTLTYDGTALTKVDREDNATNIGAEIWYLLSPTTGSSLNMVATYTASIQQPRLAATCLSGTHASPIGNSSKGGANGSQPSTNLTTGTNNSWVIDAVGANAEELSGVGAGQTQRWLSVNGNGNLDGGGSTETTTTAGSVTMSWTAGGASPNWAQVCVEIKEAVTSSFTPKVTYFM